MLSVEIIIITIISLSFRLCLCCSNDNDGCGDVQRFAHPSKHEDGSVRFLVVGDWGRGGAYNQSQVAFQMGKAADKLGIDFVVSTGDNFYDDGLTSVHDAALQHSFTNIYTAKSLQTQWYTVLGNHDYRGDAVAQLSPFLREIDNRWLCLRSFIVHSELVELFFVDTTPFVQEYFTEPEGHTYDWRGINPPKSYISNLLKDLEQALTLSTAKWKIVVGHHAISSIGHHGDTKELRKQLLPLLQANDVDFYMNGHDHCLEHISDTESPIQFLTSGAGSKAWRGDIKETKKRGVNFFYDGQGFMSVKLTQTDADIEFHDVNGKILHRFTSSIFFHVKVRASW
ncbi:Purple acid phosphatase 17, variant 2 [Stylosanthes scabra]|uniref:Purple acid phosphatase n=2 Tax=Stylosanthes scabra TaxID=79078 RepID=A0ABU6QC29_9FABA|nr:Purple acid phosphatase 17, variant 2 [Stylosanthes scabra]